MSPSARLRRLSLALVLLTAACGGTPSGAFVQTGPLQVREKGGEWADVADGPTEFGDGGALQVAADATATIRIACGDDPVRATGDPPAGTADVVLSRGAILSRRSGTYFDLTQGTLVVHAGPVRSRIVMFHGKIFLEVQDREVAKGNADGVQFTVATTGDRVDIAVTAGTVLLSAPGATPQALDFVTLGPGESGSAEPGRKPDKQKAEKAGPDEPGSEE